MLRVTLQPGRTLTLKLEGNISELKPPYALDPLEMRSLLGY
jgi:hypothetical protein